MGPVADKTTVQQITAVTPYVTKDGSLIREIIHPDRHGKVKQSLAEATVAPGTATSRHVHERSEEIYFITAGTGMVEVAGNEVPVTTGTAVLIPPGTVHGAKNTGREELKILCCCVPPYDHDDTKILDQEE